MKIFTSLIGEIPTHDYVWWMNGCVQKIIFIKVGYENQNLVFFFLFFFLTTLIETWKFDHVYFFYTIDSILYHVLPY